MTVEQRTVIPLSDIDAIEFECIHCHAIYSIPLSEITNDGPRLSCINCPQQFADSLHTDSGKMTDAQVLSSLIVRLRDAQQRPYKAIIRLAISDSKRPIGRDVSRDSGDGT